MGVNSLSLSPPQISIFCISHFVRCPLKNLGFPPLPPRVLTAALDYLRFVCGNGQSLERGGRVKLHLEMPIIKDEATLPKNCDVPLKTQMSRWFCVRTVLSSPRIKEPMCQSTKWAFFFPASSLFFFVCGRPKHMLRKPLPFFFFSPDPPPTDRPTPPLLLMQHGAG